MSNIWNPWHGCRKVSEGCQNCYMYFLDSTRNRHGSEIYKVKNNFNLPLKKDRQGNYKIKSGERIRVCMTSDFFLEEADSWRDEAWDMMRQRPDVLFFLLTKRAERVETCLPKDWGNGWNNICMNVTAENQRRADERISILLDLPFQYKGVVAAPLLEEIHIEKYLEKGKIDTVTVGGENYSGARPCDYAWVKSLYEQCVQYDVNFNFYETGSHFIKDGKHYHITKELQEIQAAKSGLYHQGSPIVFTYTQVQEYKQLELFNPVLRKKNCLKCSSCHKKNTCSGCSNCGRC